MSFGTSAACCWRKGSCSSCCCRVAFCCITLGGTLSLTSLNVTTALGYTPYNATNPSGYTNNVGTVTSVATGTGLTGGSITSSGTISFSTAAVGTWAATPSSANLASAMTDETGSGSLVFGTSPTFTTSITVNGQTVSGYNTTPLQGAIKDGVTSILVLNYTQR